MPDLSIIVGYEDASLVSTPAAVAVTETRQALAGNCLKGALLRSLSTNTHTIYIGGPDVTSATGLPIYPGESFAPPDAVNDLSRLSVICAAGETAELRVLVTR
jgi:hypothetical protein